MCYPGAPKAVCIILLLVLGGLLLGNEFNAPDLQVARGPSFGIIAAESGGALVGGVVGGGLAAGAVCLCYSPSNDPGPFAYFGRTMVGLAGITIGYPIGCAAGICAIGKIAQQDGTFGYSLLGAALGTPIALGLAFAAIKLEERGDGGILLLIPAFLAPPAGAVIGYNLSRTSEMDGGEPRTPSLDARFGLPSVCLKTELLEDGKRVSIVDFRLINVRY